MLGNVICGIVEQFNTQTILQDIASSKQLQIIETTALIND